MNKRLRIADERLRLPQNRRTTETQSSDADTASRQEEKMPSFLSSQPPPNYSISRISLSNASTQFGTPDSSTGGDPEADYTFSLMQRDWPRVIAALQRLSSAEIVKHIADLPFEFTSSLLGTCQKQEAGGQNMTVIRGPLMERRYQDALARAGEHPPALEAREIVEILNGFNDTDIAQRVEQLPPGFLEPLQEVATGEKLERVCLPLMNRLGRLHLDEQPQPSSSSAAQGSVLPEHAPLAIASVLGPPLVDTPLGPVSPPTGPVSTPLGPVSPPTGPVDTPLGPVNLAPEAEDFGIAEAEAAETTLTTVGEDAALETALMLVPEEASIPVVGWIAAGVTVVAVGLYLGRHWLLSPQNKPVRMLTRQEVRRVSPRPEVPPAHLPGSGGDQAVEDPTTDEPQVMPGSLNYTPAIDPATGQPLYAPGSMPQSDETLEAAWWGRKRSKKQKRGANQSPEAGGGPDDGFPRRLIIGGISGRANPDDTVLDSIELLNEVRMDAYDIAEYRFLWSDLDREQAKLAELSHKIKIGGFLHFSVVTNTGSVSEENLRRLRVILEESSYETTSMTVVGRIIQGQARVIPLVPTLGEPSPYRESASSYLFRAAEPADEEYRKLLEEAEERTRLEEVPTEREIPAAPKLDSQDFDELLEIHDINFAQALEGSIEPVRRYNKILLRDPAPANRINGLVLKALLARLQPGGQLDIDLDISQSTQKVAEFDAWVIEQSLITVLKLPKQNVDVRVSHPQEGSMVGARLQALITNSQ